MKKIMSLVVVLASLLVGQAGHAQPPIGATSVFARIGAPGMPEGIAVRDGVVFVSTHVSVRGNAGGPPSKIFRFDLATGALLGDITITGQNLSATHGTLAMTFDAAGRLYVGDRNPARVLRIDLGTGTQETYATVPDLAACRPVVGPTTNCAPVTVDEPTFLDYLAFAPDGSMYITDLQAATIFRVPPGGGPAQVWYQDADFDGIFGVNGIAVDPAGTKLFIAMTVSQTPGAAARGIIYTLPVVAAPARADLRVFHTFLQPAVGPDGMTFGASGKLYVALAGSNQIAIVGPGHAETIFPDAASNALQEIPYDLPASIGFDGDGSILVTNQSFFAADENHWAVLRAFVGDTALPLIEP